jgi:peptidoglycan/LPS O-acetylase OafA/YrhL
MRIKSLDVLRGVAILLVLGEHKFASDLWLRVGWSGVDLFFVLSGFLISGLLFAEYKKHGSIRVSRFLIRRGLRIYPAYYLALAYFVGRDMVRGQMPSTQAAMSVVFLQNYGPGPINHTWSLAVEEHFYLLLPATLLLLIWGARRGNSGEQRANPFAPLPRVVLAVAVLILTLRIATFVLVPYHNETHHFPTHLRLDSLLFGVLIGYAYHFHFDGLCELVDRRRWVLVAAACTLLSVAVVFEREGAVMATIGFSALYLGYGATLVLSIPLGSAQASPATSESAWQRLGKHLGSAAAFVGYYSYAIYLWHPPVAGAVGRFERMAGIELHYLVSFGLYVALSIAMGIAMTKLVEMPVLRIRDRIWPARGTIG